MIILALIVGAIIFGVGLVIGAAVAMTINDQNKKANDGS